MSESSFTDFIEQFAGDDALRVEEHLGGGFYRLRVDEAERRQARHDIRCVEDIVIEMLRNARDAHARRIYLAISRDGSVRHLAFLDDGDGIAPHMHESIFEARVTSKLETMVMDSWGVHGRGMALYSIKCNTKNAIVKSSGDGLGSSFVVDVELSELPERADQATLPKISRGEDGQLRVSSGPHNILRTVVEFELECNPRVQVIVGTPSEVVARMIEDGRERLGYGQLLLFDDIMSLPVCERPAAAKNVAELMDVCKAIGLPISERTAHRIFARQIEIQMTPLETVLEQQHPTRDPGDALLRDRRGLKINPDDIEQFASELEDAIDDLAKRYFFKLDGSPVIRVGKDAITVRYSIEKEL